ncbi:metalloprotease PmbA [Aestuariirhabdus litorea]|uniref:Metalloprotease PmbA n=1 Tax=Aestuariirhabdus litorea TaxID=2528527 RepID=A0A3P3VLU8_9GAMM|nr:metalloprotease PmbA [Aestuariirhabdus litorea]RRJ83715.1 metalloprotease PmbA [Aestuariirhabdus litorea]RWW96937.1 metalloprotease PmbA [Endozoicomonadaceae bacterium GTF-13]
MTSTADTASLDLCQEQQRLQQLVEDILREARKKGASGAEVGVSLDSGLTASVRRGEVDTVEFNRDQGFGITLYYGQRKGSASTSDSSPQAIIDTVEAASNIARYTSEDPFAGLADAELMAADLPDLDLYHPWELEVEQALEIATRCEQAGFERSDRITNSEGASLSNHQSCRVYGNSHGFIGSYLASRQSLSCVLIAGAQERMQRDYWYSVARRGADLESAEQVGVRAANRTLQRLDPRKLKTCQVPVLFSSDVAGGLLSHLLGAISGSSLYREASFLLGQLDKPLFPDFVTIYEQPRLKGGLASASFDNDGLATYDKAFVRDGVLCSYLLGVYSARKLGMTSTANAGGVHNLRISDSGLDESALLAEMGSGLLVTELLGQGVNLVTGDYSRGASGFWVEQGVIQYPVSEITIAGNLRDMFANLVAVGNDVDRRGNVQTGSILIDGMMVGGN